MTEPVYLTTKELATRLRVTPGTISVWRHRGEGPPHVKLVGKVLYRLEDVEDWERDNTHSTGGQAA